MLAEPSPPPQPPPVTSSEQIGFLKTINCSCPAGEKVPLPFTFGPQPRAPELRGAGWSAGPAVGWESPVRHTSCQGGATPDSRRLRSGRRASSWAPCFWRGAPQTGDMCLKSAVHSQGAWLLLVSSLLNAQLGQTGSGSRRRPSGSAPATGWSLDALCGARPHPFFSALPPLSLPSDLEAFLPPSCPLPSPSLLPPLLPWFTIHRFNGYLLSTYF